MRINIKKGLRTILLLMIGTTLCVLVFMLSKELSAGEIAEEKVPIYAYSQKADIDYNVFLKPNILYEEKSLEKGGTYITSYLDYIDLSMSYTFTGERPAGFSGEYEIIGELEGYTIINDASKTIWKKANILKGRTPFEGNGTSIEIKEEIPIGISEYNEFANVVLEETGIITNVRMNVFWNVELQAETDGGNINEEMAPFAVIPIGTKYFEISGQLNLEETGSLDELRQVELPADGDLIGAYGLGIGILSLALILMLIFTKAGNADPIEKELKKIFKKHRERLAALNGEVSVEEGKGSIVKSIDDLVKIADELGKPIMYRYSADFRKMTKFYVFDDNKTYIFNLEEAISEEEKTNKEKKTKKSKKDRNNEEQELIRRAEEMKESKDEYNIEV